MTDVDDRDRTMQHHGTTTGRWPPRDDGRKTNTVYPVKYLVVAGGLPSGFTFYGPFDNVNTACQWAAGNLKKGTRFDPLPFFDVRNDA